MFTCNSTNRPALEHSAHLMMTKHFASNSVMRRASQFENLNHDQSGSGSSQPPEGSSIKRPSLSRKDDKNGCNPIASSNADQLQFISSIFARFQREFASLYPDSALPFEELTSFEEARKHLKIQQQRIADLNVELSKAKFAANFLQGIISRNETRDFVDKSSLNSTPQHYGGTAVEESSPNGESTSSNEQYVTVITLNDSTYGEIQRPKVVPTSGNSSSLKINNNSGSSISSGASNESTNDELQLNEASTKEEPNQSKSSEAPETTTTKEKKSEPIYSNTLESQKSSNNNSDKVAKKRPPTPPRKPKFNKLQGSSGDIFGSLSSSSPAPSSTSISKSESLKSISRIQRKFNGPLQQISDAQANSTNNSGGSNKSPEAETTNKEKDNKPNKAVPYMRTFSHEPTTATRTPTAAAALPTATKDENTENEDDTDDNADSDLYKDYDNIYDTVAPDSDCDSDLNEEEKANSTRDEDNETSSHEMLSRSSSTDEGLSNYVNIDYFLRKNSLGRSNSNIPTRLKNKKNSDEFEDTEHEDTSMKSSDYDNFSSNENLINSIPPSTSLKSFNSMSTNSSTSGSSLRTRSLKMLSSSNTNDLSCSYPPNMSTFTPPIRNDRTQYFFKESPLNEHEEGYSNGAELHISPIPRTSLDKSKSNHSVEYYAYTDILDSLPVNNEVEPKVVDLAEESIQMENKSLGECSDSTNEESKSSAKGEVDHCRHMQWNIIRSIIESETVYLDCLNTLQQYMKALSTTTSGRDNALLTTDDLNTIFFRIPDLYQLHNQFLNGLKNVEHGYKLKHSVMTGDSKLATKLMTKHSVGELFFRLASSLGIYSDFLRNYSKALETANRCSAHNTKFSDIIKSIKVASLNGQFTNLVDLLHKPVARLQKNALVLHDLLKYVDSRNEEEQNLLKEALKMTQAFLNELNLDATRKLFPVQDKFQRRLVKESFIVESGENRRKLRHLFLFNDVIVCAKYKASTKQKFTFELKWFQMLSDIVLDPALELFSSSNSSSSSSSTLNRSLNTSSSHSSALASNSATAKENKDTQNSINQVESLKSRAFACRYDNFIEEKKSKGSSKTSEKHRKKIFELESELVLWLPPLKFSFSLKNNSNKNFTFYLSSEYERTCWVDAIKHLQQVTLNSSHNEHVGPIEMQRWIESCRKSINPNLGTFLLRTNKDESLRFGDLSLRFLHLNGFNHKQNLYFVVETDSYGHYFKQAVTRYVSDDEKHNIDQEFLLELEGTQSLRILCYETPKRSLNAELLSKDKENEVSEKHSIFRGKASFDLTSSCFLPDYGTKELSILDYSLSIQMSFTSWKSMMEKIPPNKICGTFGINIAQVCKKEKSKIPYIIMSCVNEVQRRGLREVGIYRVSGLNSDVQKLRKAFETSPRDASWMIGHVDIHTVTGLLKNYLRDLPESLFTNDMYQKYIEARDLKNPEEKERRMTALLAQLPEPNKSTIIFLIDHLALVNCYEDENKMSLNNLATVFGPTMLKTNSSSGNNSGGKNTNSSASSSTPSSSTSNAAGNFASFAINTDLFTASTIDVMAQADIIYFYLRRKSEGLSLTSIDREETSL